MAYTPAPVSLPRKLDPAFATTDDIMAAANITRSTVKVWSELGLLPPPLKMSLGMAGGVFNRYPAWAVDRARFVAVKRAAGFTYDEIRAMLASLEVQEAREARAPQGAPAVKPRTSKAADAKRPRAAANKSGRGRR